ncbi:glycosyltransferase family 4 protein [Rhodocytophaga aerolata]|uniref:Glycosyltransferase family 4 protein n=1 Tax=Rhodocytophaga aerolata TaxID=455078 RepID=A0ABT8RFX7_9BACT|nr:glycosyltransferase family 4 protein [Rhodocytophaga aerolata]MDO1451008.1 glycosyltransferase family 4 protein [Rhodocytophaga aerolata]
MKNLAVIAPNLGARSEIFIQRHMEDLLPGRTVVIALSDKPPYCGYWKVDSPTLIIQDIVARDKVVSQTKVSLKKQIYQAALYKIGFRKPVRQVKRNAVDDAIEYFLVKHNVGAILSEYLDHSLDYIHIAQKLNIPFYAHAHGYDVSLRLKNEEWRKKYLALNEIDGIIMMNEYSRQALIKIGIKEEKLHTIPYGVLVPKKKEYLKKGSQVKCLAVGRMVAKKAPILLMDSFRRAVEVYPDMHLDYVGAGDLLPAVKQYIQAFNLHDKVTLYGALDNGNVLQFMQQADIFLQHSVTCFDTGDQEGFPVAILEAMAHELPVISTLHSGIPEAVIDGQTGLLVPEGNSVLMAEKIVKLATDIKLTQHMGKKGRIRLEQCFSWEKERDSLLSLINIT